MTTLVGYVLGVGDDPEVRAGVIQGVIVKMVGFFVGSPARVTGHDEDLPGQENVYLPQWQNRAWYPFLLG